MHASGEPAADDLFALADAAWWLGDVEGSLSAGEARTGISQGAEDALGAQAGETELRQVALDAGLSSVRRAAETPFNVILEARP